MSNQLTVIADTLRAPETTGKLMLALGYDDPNDPQAKNDAKRYAASVLAEIEKSYGSKQDLTTCAPHSIVRSMVDAAQFRLMIDGRQLAHLVKYGNNATFMPGYRGYLFKVKEAYPDADVTVRPIYEGETVRIQDESGLQSYTVTGDVDPFDMNDSKFKGVLVAVTYTDNGRLVRKVQAVPKSRIDRARNAAKQDYIWKTDYIEKAKAAAIKAAFKIMFSSIQGLQEMIQYDNKKHYDIEKPIEDTKPGSIVDNLNKSFQPDEEVIDVSHETIEDAPQIDQDEPLEGELVEEPENKTEAQGLSQEEIERMAKRVANAIKREDTEEGMQELFDADYYDDLQIIKAASDKAYNHLLGLRDIRLKQIREGA